MATDIATLQKMYLDSCSRHGVLPNTSVLSCFLKAEVTKSCNELCSLDIFFEQLKDIDFPPLLDLCMSIETSEIEAVDVYNGSSCMLNGEYALPLMRSFNQKLRLVDLRDSLYGNEVFRDLSQGGLACEVLYLSSSCLQNLSMTGEFMHIRILNLDFNTSLTSFREDCFTCMPNLISLSMCATRVANLWTTLAAISKLPSLIELRFQKWLCCNETASSSAPYGGKLDDQPEFGPVGNINEHLFGAEETLGNVISFDDIATNKEEEIQWMIEDPSDDSEMNFSSYWQESNHTDSLSIASLGWNRENDLQDEVSFGPTLSHIEASWPNSLSSHTADVAMKYISRHASPICHEKHYREFMIASLPHLKTLDNLSIRKNDKEKAVVTFAEHFEYLPYKRNRKESVVGILHKREIKESRTCLKTKNRKPSYPCRNSQHFYSRSFSAAKVGSSAWPYLRSLSLSCPDFWGRNYFRPRQFEYHPSISSLLVFGTLDGEVVVVNHESEKIVSYVPSLGAMNSVLGLCWLKKYPSKLIAGSDNGSLKLYDVEHMPPTVPGVNSAAGSVTFEDFDQLTSVHVNAMDELFLVSGYSKNIALYDINCGRRIQMFTDMHTQHINVVKFSNHSPSLFATSSFDRDVKLWDLRQKPLHPCYTSASSRGNVMVCFSPDDHYLLVSAVDNEVRQLLAVDGRPHLNFEIPPTGTSQNYTRSYYMNGRDYIVSGSCDEHVVRICCAQTGRRLKDISLEETSMYVQSLRGDPFRDFNMSILAASVRPNSKYEIVKVNLLASCDGAKECSYREHLEPSISMGG
ncbi:protein DWD HYPERSENSITIVE TO UV-B 1 [Euphorbia lathyris]|uniref:protein DWD HYPERSENSITIVE TO UV-B 1 n=1 Tax=Euphorbia lathyris TaxID=212925 RepID=UPI0033138A2E